MGRLGNAVVIVLALFAPMSKAQPDDSQQRARTASIPLLRRMEFH